MAQSTAKRLSGLRMCQRSLLDRLSSEDEDDKNSDCAELSCVFFRSAMRGGVPWV